MPRIRGEKHHWFGRDVSGELNPAWKGGRYINHSGYVMVLSPYHNRAMENGYVREHIILAECALGRKLPPNAQVHHFGEPYDNSKIVICENQEYHFLLHMRQKSFDECGDPNKRKCKFCKEYDFVENLHNKQCKPHGWNTYHLSCAMVYDRQRYRRKRVGAA